MLDLSGNIKISFGAKYVAEDMASYILHDFDRSSLDGRRVDVERLARYIGLDVACEYLSGDCLEMLGVVTFEPQRVVTDFGYLDLSKPTAIIERDIIDRGEYGLYRLTLAFECSHALFNMTFSGEAENAQLSFGFESVPSMRKRIVTLNEAFGEIGRYEEGVYAFALKLMMPKNGFKRQAVNIYSRLGINRATAGQYENLTAVSGELAEIYGIPTAAVLARMKQLNLF